MVSRVRGEVRSKVALLLVGDNSRIERFGSLELFRGERRGDGVSGKV